MARALLQAKRFGVEVVVTRAALGLDPGTNTSFVLLDGGDTVEARSLTSLPATKGNLVIKLNATVVTVHGDSHLHLTEGFLGQGEKLIVKIRKIISLRKNHNNPHTWYNN